MEDATFLEDPDTPAAGVTDGNMERAQQDARFKTSLDYYLREFCGRPTPLALCRTANP
jgi:tryptophan synthase beta subunit